MSHWTNILYLEHIQIMHDINDFIARKKKIIILTQQNRLAATND